ncbi:patched 1 [Paragonimus westermani]|uniref:Patched 1 n=1 Tax=Paragonimus westermani TaxID=34504 RepID=A0A5J4P1N0_9TREM|nr:patched 1 [Paragonimus westermani]
MCTLSAANQSDDSISAENLSPASKFGTEAPCSKHTVISEGTLSNGYGTISKGLWASSVCCATMRLWWQSKFARFEEFVHAHHWKALSGIILLGLFCLGLKLAAVDSDFDKLWVGESDRLTSEWRYLAEALQRTSPHGSYGDPSFWHYLGQDSRRPHTDRSRRSLGIDETNFIPGPPQGWSKSSAIHTTGLPGHEFMGTMETVLQVFSKPSHVMSEADGLASQTHILTPHALLDHMEFLIKVRRLQITVGSSKWSFKDLCQRATLPFGAEGHHIQASFIFCSAYLDMIIPCLIITPLDCFWEGSKVLGPEEAMWVPWFNERTLIQWTNLDPVGLLEKLQRRYGNHSRAEISTLISLFHAAGVSHGYLNRTCLDPTDLACPISAPNYRDTPPDVSKILSGGCPGFAGNMLHWPEEIIVGGRVHRSASGVCVDASHNNPSAIVGSAQTDCTNHSVSPPLLVRASALQSLIMLRSPRDLYDAVRFSDPYKYEGWTLADAQHVLDEWRRNFRRLVIEHNVGLQANNYNWSFYAFTDNSLRDLLREMTLRIDPIKIVGCVLLVFLYGLVCLLDWRDPVQSQCWLALSGLLLTALASVAGLGICAAVGLPFNVLTIQGSWTSNSSIATCTSSSTASSICTRSSSALSRQAPVLAEHGPGLLFGTIALSGAFFSASYIPIPLMRQFCLQAGTLVLVQSTSLIFLFPALLKLDGTRRNERRLDVLCCLQQPRMGAVTVRHHSHPHSTDAVPSASSDLPAQHTCLPQTPLRTTSHRTTCPGVTRSHSCTAEMDACACSSIQVNVVSHVTEGAGSSTSPMCHSTPNDVVNKPCHTLRTTVTLTGPKRDPVIRVSDDHRCRRVQRRSDAEVRKPTRSSLHPSPCGYRLQCHDQPVPEQYAQLVLPERQYEHSSPGAPCLVRFARRLALLLTFHWIVQLMVCVLGIGLFVVAGVLTRSRLKLGLDWSSLAPMDAVEHGFVRYSERYFGLHNFQIIARGTDLPGSRSISSLNGIIRTGIPADTASSPTSAALKTKTRMRTSFATVGRGIDFPMQQRQLLNLYTRLTKLPGVVLAGHRFWLEAMRDWLQMVQNAFDTDRSLGLISPTGHWSPNASELGVLGLRLIVQTDRGPELSRAHHRLRRRSPYQYDFSVAERILIVFIKINTGRLVHGGIVDPPAFYALLRVWKTYDALNFSSLACVIHPEPGPILIAPHSGRPGRPNDLHMLPPADPIEFVQTNFYAVAIQGMQVQLNLVQNVRLLTDSATAQGVPVFPIGSPFTFAEHYLYLIRETAIALGLFFAILLSASLLLFSSPVIVVLLVVVGAAGGLSAAVCGLALLHLDLNPISAVLLLFSAGLGARSAVSILGSWPTPHFTPRRIDLGTKRFSPVPFCSYSTQKPCTLYRCPHCAVRKTTGFINHNLATANRILEQPTALGTRPRRSRPFQFNNHVRMRLASALSNQLTPVLHSTVCLILALALLAAARVQFIASYFFALILVVSLACLFNAICFIPTLCHLTYPIQQYFTPPKSYPKPAQLRYPLSRVDRLVSTAAHPVVHSAASDDLNAVPVNISSSPGSITAPCTSDSSTIITTSHCSPQAQFCASSVDPSQAQLNLTTKTSSVSSLTLVSSTPSAFATFPVPKSAHVASVCPAPDLSDISRKWLTDYTHSQLYDLCNRHLRELPVDCQQSPEAAAAAVVVAVAAAASSVRSRPASLSTISEEPSHSSSTVSLNRLTPSASVPIQVSHPDDSILTELESMVEDDSRPRNLQTNRPVDLLELTKLLSLDNPAANFYRQICESLLSLKSAQNSGTPKIVSVHPHDLHPDPASTILSSFGDVQQSSSASRHCSSIWREKNMSPPPSYSSVIQDVDCEPSELDEACATSQSGCVTIPGHSNPLRTHNYIPAVSHSCDVPHTSTSTILINPKSNPPYHEHTGRTLVLSRSVLSPTHTSCRLNCSQCEQPCGGCDLPVASHQSHTSHHPLCARFEPCHNREFESRRDHTK